MHRVVKLGLLTVLFAGVADAPRLQAQETAQDPELAKAMEFFSTAGIPGDKWIEGETMVPHVAPASHFKANMLYYPGTEELQEDEVRVTFMGSTYYPNQSQSGMSVFVELGNGDNFVFDLGIGSLRNYNSFSIPFNTINHVFFTHLHMDHMSDLPYFMMFRPVQGGWTPLHIYGPSGSQPEYGIAHLIDRMMEMTAWHQDSFHNLPIGDGYDPVVHQFDFMDEGGVVYEQDGVTITHWPTSHTKDGATSYRLDWNGRSLCYTGDNRPNSLTIKYCLPPWPGTPSTMRTHPPTGWATFVSRRNRRSVWRRTTVSTTSSTTRRSRRCGITTKVRSHSVRRISSPSTSTARERSGGGRAWPRSHPRRRGRSSRARRSRSPRRATRPTT